MPAEDAEMAWTRAKAWLSRWSDYKLQIVDSTILETYNPIGDSDFKYGYSVSREQNSDGTWRFDVRAVSAAGRLIDNRNLERMMAQALALYISTGEEFPGGHGTGDRSRY